MAPVVALTALLAAGSIPLPGAAAANPFDCSGQAVGPALNEALSLGGSAIRFAFDGCGQAAGNAADRWEQCRFHSPLVTVAVLHDPGGTRIVRIVIAADLLRHHPETLPHMVVADALVTLMAAMTRFDPGLAADGRHELASALAQALHGIGQGTAAGIDADYEAALEQTSTTLLVITVVPKARP